jgi:pimeloyl-ACP methyl ester carboxylesterase
MVNGLRLHFVEAGTGPLVILLHGFPEFWYSWRRQVPALASAGFRVLAPDLRGYNESAKPEGVRAYRMDLLVKDVVGLIEWAGTSRAILIGHDWGGIIAWHVAMRHPEAIAKLVILNAPHPAAFLRELRTLDQWLRSAYVVLFQIPWVSERILRAEDFRFLERLFRRRPSNPDAFTAEDIQHYKNALGRPGALTAALNYYRAALRFPSRSVQTRCPIQAPTLVIWGERDPYLSARLCTGLETLVADLRVELLPEASHWVQNDAAERVNGLLSAFLK